MKLLNKFKPLLLTILLAVSILIISIHDSKAAEYKITCDSSGCTSPGTAIFNETNIAPGDSITKYIEVKNNYNETLNLNMTTTKDNNTDDIFLDVIDVIVIGLDDQIRFDDTLRQFLNDPIIDLGSINDSGQDQVKITLSFQNVDNQYQGKQAVFDIPINIKVQGQGENLDDSSTPTFSFNPTGKIAGVTTTQSSSSPGGQIKGAQSTFSWLWLLLLIPFGLIFFLLYRRRLQKSKIA